MSLYRFPRFKRWCSTICTLSEKEALARFGKQSIKKQKINTQWRRCSSQCKNINIQRHDKEKCTVSHEWKSFVVAVHLPLCGQYALCLPGSWYSLSCSRFDGGRRFEVSYWQSSLQLNPVQYFLLYSEFFIACIILGLEDLQKNSIIHRDIKP